MNTAVILAGGRGTRLAPYTAFFPKPLVPIGDFPVVEILVRQLHAAGFRRLIFATGHLSELLRAYFHQHPLIRMGMEFCWIREEEPLGTAAPLGLIDDFPENALVLNGDLFTTMDFSGFFSNHVDSRCALSVAAHTRKVCLSLGVLSREGDRVTGYNEKPSYTFDVSMGIYGVSRRVLDHIPRNVHMDFPELVTTLLSRGETVRCENPDCRWLDIGNPEDYAAAQAEFEKNASLYMPED
ncbi:MAG: sugar phosphate nucleotidyltransferase [Candidatus Fermentibacteraceae bacterium]